MPKNKKIILTGVVILVLLGSVFVYKNIKKQNNSLALASPTTSKTIPQINNLSFTDDVAGKISVYEFMNKLQDEGKINFTEKDYIGMGEFITSINGVKNSNTQSWIYYVNGVEAQVGVSNYKINTGDIVSWKYEKSNY